MDFLLKSSHFSPPPQKKPVRLFLANVFVRAQVSGCDMVYLLDCFSTSVARVGIITGGFYIFQAFLKSLLAQKARIQEMMYIFHACATYIEEPSDKQNVGPRVHEYFHGHVSARVLLLIV